MTAVAVPTTMTYIDHGKGGPASVLVPTQGPVPQPKDDEVLIRVAYAGVNRPDVSQRQGTYPPPPGASPIIGLEVAGEVVAAGAAVTDYRVGDAVCALCNGGGYAQYVAVAAGQVLPVPRGLSLEQAAALPENYFTVWTNVMERGRLAGGETFLVHGGSSGIGLTAIQMAKSWGATVYTTVGSAQKAEVCRQRGADVAINYREQDFVEEVLRLTDKRGVDLVLDMVGGEYIPKNLRLMAPDGRIVQIAFLKGSKAEIDFTTLMVKRLTYTGSTLRPRTPEKKAAIARELRAQVWPRLERGEILPYLYKTFALDEAAQAHALMESSTHIGKILLKV